MPREILVVTPENIEIEYELAGVGSRFLANLLDILWQTLIFVLLGIAVGILGVILSLIHAKWAASVEDFVEGILGAVVSISFFLVMWGFFLWYEIRWNGQTPGKRQMGLRVIRDGGYPVNVYAVIARNLLRVVDGMPVITLGLIIAGLAGDDPGLGALGGLSILVTLGFMLFSGRYQRLGDFVAGTMVVKQRAPRVPTLEALAPPPRVLPEHLAPYALADIGRQVYEMTVPEYRAVRHYIDRRWQLPPLVQQQAAMMLAVPLMQRLNIRPPAGVLRINYADFLEYLAVAFEQYRGVK
jgi:uncharacterized RDD family membrane protein YckC